MAVAALLTIAWGALAFGGAYPWAYWPLMWAAVVTGALGLRDGARVRETLASPLAVGLAAVIAAGALQVVPLPPAALRVVSPSTVAFRSAYELPRDAISQLIPESSSAAPTGSWRPLSLRPEATRGALAFLVTLGVLLLGGTSGFGTRDARRLAGGLVLVGLVVALAGIVQRATPGARIYGFWEPWIGGNPFGPFVNRNHFAGWMLMAMSASIGYFLAIAGRAMRGVKRDWRHIILALSSRRSSQVLLVGVAVGVMALSLVLTLSRSGVLGFGVAILLVAVRLLRRQSGARRLVIAGYLAVMFVAAIGWTGLGAISTRFAALDTGRPLLWRNALEVVRRFPLTGTGLSTYTAVTPFFKSEPASASNDEAHNDYLQLAAEGGVLVVAPAVWLIVLFALEVRRRFQAEDDEGSSYWIRLGAVTGIVAIALQELVEFSLQMPGNAVLFVVLCAMAAHRRSDEPPQRTLRTQKSSRP